MCVHTDSRGTLEVVPIPSSPMLAASRAPLPLAGEWVLEPKFDGRRAIVAVADDVRVWARNGRELTPRLPELG